MKLLGDNDPLLKQVSDPYTKEEILSQGTRVFVNELFNTMFDNKGMGIAAVQVGILKRVICIHVPGFSEVMFNPVILRRKGKCDFIEGCLSFPGINLNINRSEQITVKWLDKNANLRYADLDGLPARVVQHEVDHLFGKVFTER
jgi:peptide deformylase